MLRYARISPSLQICHYLCCHRHWSWPGSDFESSQPKLKICDSGGGQDEKSQIRLQFKGYIRALISLLIRKHLENTHILHQHWATSPYLLLISGSWRQYKTRPAPPLENCYLLHVPTSRHWGNIDDSDDRCLSPRCLHASMYLYLYYMTPKHIDNECAFGQLEATISTRRFSPNL